MSFETMEISYWFSTEDSEADEEAMSILKALNQRGAAVLELARESKANPDALKTALFEFYKFWKTVDPNDVLDARSTVSDFIKEVVRNSVPESDPHEVLSDIIFGHVGIQFCSFDDLPSGLSREDLKLSVDTIVSDLRKHGQTTIPGLLTIKIRKNEPTDFDPSPPSHTTSYSLLLKDLKSLPDADDSEDDNAQNKALRSFVKTIVKFLKSDNRPIRIEGLGVFQAEERPGFEGRNPSTGEKIQQPGRRLLTFRLDKAASAGID